jgi:hypothetical protein
MTFSLVVGGVFFVVALGLLTSANYRLTVLLGAPCGVALGVWLLAPLWLNTHYLFPETFAHWLIVDAFLVVIFGLGGLALALSLTWPLSLMPVTPWSKWRISSLGAVVLLVITLPVGLVGVGFLLEWGVFRRTHQLRSLLSVTAPVGATIIPLVSFLVCGWMWSRRHGHQASGRLVAWSATAVAAAGLLLLPLRVSRDATAVDVAPLIRRHTEAPAPLFVVGVDAASWRVLRPLIEARRLPTLARIVADGLHGEVLAPWPPYWSGPAWGAIVTGHSKDATSVHEDLSAEIRGLPKFQLPLAVDLRLNPLSMLQAILVVEGVMRLEPFPRDILRIAPVWERLHEVGTRTAVVRFPFTYPAIGQAEHVISFKVVSDFWDMLGVKPGTRDLLVSSSRDRDSLLRWFLDGPKIDQGLFHGVLSRPDWPQPVNTRLNPSAVMAELLTTGHRTVDVTQQILRENEGLEVLMLYIGEFDVASHALWPYRFPADYPQGSVHRHDIDALGPVFDRYAIDLDTHLGELLGGFRETPNVLIVSDHGAGPSEVATIWHGWHGPRGVFVAAGPDIPRDPRFLSISYLDVVPTMLDLLNFDQPADLAGKSVLRMRTAVGTESALVPALQ